jgi:hypothetical protein
MEPLENVLSNFGLLWGSCSAKVIKGQIKPFIDALMDAMIFIAQFLT